MIISDAPAGPLAVGRAGAGDRAQAPEREGGKEIAVLRQMLQVSMTGSAGVVRDASHPEAALEAVNELGEDELGEDILREAPTSALINAASVELANLVTVARALIASALCREESRGAHYREDFPSDEERWRRRLVHGTCGISDRSGDRSGSWEAPSRLERRHQQAQREVHE
jgi:succinate dehydrogenase/fumarate reductase flavoprotein subunit